MRFVLMVLGIVILALVTLYNVLWGPMWSMKEQERVEISEYEYPAPDAQEQSLMDSAQNNPFSRKELAALRTQKALEILDTKDSHPTSLADALVYAASGVDLNPNAPQSWITLGMAYMAQGENRLAYEKAQEAFETALMLAPQEPAISYLLGQALFAQGAYYGARQAWLPVLLLRGDDKLSIDLATQTAQTYVLSADVEEGVEQAQALYADNKDNVALLAFRSLLELAQFRRAQAERDDTKIAETQRIDFYDSSTFNLQQTLAVWEEMTAPEDVSIFYTSMLNNALNDNKTKQD